MTIRKIQVVRDTSGVLREYELDNEGITIKQNGELITEEHDSITKTKRIR